MKHLEAAKKKYADQNSTFELMSFCYVYIKSSFVK